MYSELYVRIYLTLRGNLFSTMGELTYGS